MNVIRLMAGYLTFLATVLLTVTVLSGCQMTTKGVGFESEDITINIDETEVKL